ncbi:MAG: tetratricopeptide repeat protein, partial [Chromatiales bacterium]|nr:tetratricopeptide repeat protein [Chromatiales bacterium]
MKIVVSSFALPQEMDELQRLVCQLKRAAASLSGSHEFFFDVTLATSPRLIDWTRSSLPLAFFADRLAQLERMSDWATTHFRVSDAVLGALTHRIHSFDRHPDADYFLWIDPDIVFTDQALAILEACLAELADRHRHLILTPEIVRLWDETWDCLVNPAFLDQPLGYHGTHDPFADSGIKGVVSLRPVVNGIPGQPRFKFASGWFTTLSMDLLKRTGLPRSFGPYGPEDSFIMCAAEKLLSLRAADVAQFKISNFVVCEDYRYRSHAHYLRHLATHDCKQTFRALSERNFPYELDRLGRSGWEDPGFMMTTDDVHAVLEEAVALHRRGEVEPAERRYRAILERDPEHPRAVHNLGLLLLDGGRVAPSLPLLEWAAAAESTRAAFWNTLGRARSAAGDAQRAADCFERALALDASGIDAAINLGNARFALGQLDAAAASYEAALQREPGAPEAVLGLGAIAQQRGQFAQAMSCYRETLRAFPESGDVH